MEFICLVHTGWSNSFRTIRKLKKILKRTQPLLVHSHLFESTLFARLATPSTIPLVTSIHSMYSVDAFSKNRLSVWVERITLRNRHHLIGVSRYVLNDYLKHVPFKGKTSVLYNFLPEIFFQSSSRTISKGGLRCVAVGNLKEAKNYFYLLQVFEFLKNESITLDIFGIGPQLSALQEEIKDKDLKVTLRGKGFIPESLKDFDLFLQSSLHEGFGIAVIEAMAIRMPVLISDIEVFHEITAGHAHFLNLNQPLAAAQQLLKFEQDTETMRQHVEKGYQFVREHYSQEAYKKGLLQIYQEVSGYPLAI